jgi:two-component system CheB/CheR fusion protein
MAGRAKSNNKVSTKRSAPRSKAQAELEPKRRRAETEDTADESPATRLDFPVVGIGASAGGIEAFEAFFRAMPPQNGMAFIVIAHLDPERESLLPSLIEHWTDMPVVAARDRERVAPNKVYVIPRNAVLTIAAGELRVRSRANGADRMAIDAFFTSLAEDQGENAICIILSGAGSDGSIGLKAVKEHGGLTLAQGSDGTEARFKEMPGSAAATGLVDLVIAVEHMPERLTDYVRRLPRRDHVVEASERRANALRLIYALVRARVGHDFSRYKERTFLRRVQRRMQVLQLETLEDYAERLRQDSGEAFLLFRDLLIGVTNFFRDRDAFAALEKFIPRLFEGKGADHVIRVWVIGCATGEEAYSIAMLLREHADTLQVAPKIQIFATDIDEQALATARSARYPESLLKDVSPARLKRFFTRESGFYCVTKEIRDLCVFSAHSLIRDPPFSRLDLISCRNMLIYLNPDLQVQVIPFFHYALRPGGLLFLGTSENVSRHGDLFAPLDKRWRIFERQNLVARSDMQFPLMLRSGGLRPDRSSLLSMAPSSEQGSSLPIVLRQIAAQVQEQFGPAYVVANKEGEVVYYSGRTGRYLEPAEGPPIRDLAAMARKGLRLELRTALHEARETSRTVRRDNVLVQVNGGSQAITLTVQPFVEGNETLYLVVFSDIGPISSHEPTKEVPAPASESEATIQQLERELQTTKERLQTTIEEFDTSSEELKSSNEELLSVNEELQSANEELETSKEEIQSINEELQTVNAELSGKIEELDRANADLKNLFESTQIATIILDQDLLIRNFTPAIERIFNLISSDRGRPLADIVSSLDHPGLQRDIRTAVERGQEVKRRVTAEDGRIHYLMRILPYRTPDKKVNGALITFIEITNFIRAEEHEKRFAKELDQRVKDTLSRTMSIVDDAIRRGAKSDDLAATVRDRLDAMMRLHDFVSRRNWSNASLRDLVAAELAASLRNRRNGIAIEGAEVSLTPRAAVALGMAIHELANHALGALSSAGGKVKLQWSVKNVGRKPQLILRWTEQNGRSPQRRQSASLDIATIQHHLRREVGGKAKLESKRVGLTCTMEIPLPQNVRDRAAED